MIRYEVDGTPCESYQDACEQAVQTSLVKMEGVVLAVLAESQEDVDEWFGESDTMSFDELDDGCVMSCWVKSEYMS